MNEGGVTFSDGFHQYIMLEMFIITLSLSTLSDYNCVHMYWFHSNYENNQDGVCC